MTLATDHLDQLAIDTIRTLSIDGVQQANSGHPGAPMGAAPMAYALWTRHLRHSPTQPALAQPRPLRAVGRSRVDAPVLDAPPDGLRRQPRRPQGLPPVGLDHPGPPRIRPDPGGRGDDRPARPGPRQRRRHGDRRAAAGGGVQPARARHRRPPDLRDRQRRRHAGGRRVRGELARRPPETGQADRALRRQPDPARRADGVGVQRGRARRASRPTAGTPSGSRTATTSPRSRPPSMPPRPTTGRPSSPFGPTSASAARTSRTPRRRTGRRSGPTRSADQGGLRLGSGPHVLRARRGRRAVPPRDRRRQGPRRRVGVRGSTAYAAAYPARAGGAPAAARGPAARRLGRGLPAYEVGDRGRDAEREPGLDPGAGGAAARAVRRLGGPVGVEPDRRQGRTARPLRGRPRRPQPALRRPRARDGRDRERHRLPRRLPPLLRDVPHLQRLHARVRPARVPVRPARDLRLDPRLRRASARTARRTSRSSTTRRSGRSRTCGSCGPATRTRRPRPGRWRSSGRRSRAHARPGRARVHPPEAADAGRLAGARPRGPAARRLRAARGRRAGRPS